jgi:hypothetical protein
MEHRLFAQVNRNCRLDETRRALLWPAASALKFQ